MSNYPLRKLRNVADGLVAFAKARSLPETLPLFARYAAIWHLDRLNTLLRRDCFPRMRVVRVGRDDGETVFNLERIESDHKPQEIAA